MSARIRKLVGGVAMIAFVGFYALDRDGARPVAPVAGGAGRWLQTLGYVVLGLAWTLPLMPLIKWMERPGRRA